MLGAGVADAVLRPTSPTPIATIVPRSVMRIVSSMILQLQGLDTELCKVTVPAVRFAARSGMQTVA